MKVLANDGISQEGIDALEGAGYTVLTEKIEQDQLIKEINAQNIEVLLVRSATTVRKEVFDACAGLKFVGRGGVGMDNIDVQYGRDKGRIVTNTPAASSQSVAEMVMGQMFSISRSLYHSAKHMEGGDFKTLKKKYGKGVELRGKTLAIVGFGRIGQNLAAYALGAGMNVEAVDMYPDAREIYVGMGNGLSAKTRIIPNTSLDDVLPNADYISLHVPKQPDGSAVIGAKEFAKMKDGVRIVNAARGGVVDEDALIEALDSGKVASIALDVFENEPNPRADLLSHEKIATTPHIGAATVEAQGRIGRELADAIIANFGTF
ncbi:MAG: D-2-hydroxyacid dehydrogenase [Fluviicola sp.]